MRVNESNNGPIHKKMQQMNMKGSWGPPSFSRLYDSKQTDIIIFIATSSGNPILSSHP